MFSLDLSWRGRFGYALVGQEELVLVPKDAQLRIDADLVNLPR
ncbi:hypothetical protein [Rhodanobacter sp. L36]|nr:hypothetical protein [Rhodanobacter sp. L36]